MLQKTVIHNECEPGAVYDGHLGLEYVWDGWGAIHILIDGDGSHEIVDQIGHTCTIETAEDIVARALAEELTA